MSQPTLALKELHNTFMYVIDLLLEFVMDLLLEFVINFLLEFVIDLH